MDKKKKKVTKTPWPTKKAMGQIYELKLWGDNSDDFYSGDGSHNPKIVTPYVEVVTSFLSKFKTPITVLDLGCGDFNIGKQLVNYTKKYIAVDIVEPLIAYNKDKFIYENLDFKCLDIAKDSLPKADCVMLRQVLQHLSNTEVQSVVNKLYDFKYIILTEHIPKGNFISNKDIISGQGIRIKKQSGINLLEPPFNFKVKSIKEMLSIELKDEKGEIITNLYEVF